MKSLQDVQRLFARAADGVALAGPRLAGLGSVVAMSAAMSGTVSGAVSLAGAGAPSSDDIRHAAASSSQSMGLARLRKVRIGDSPLQLYVWDIACALLSAALIFRLYAVPLHYDQRQLWVGLAGFLAAWTLGAATQHLYARRTLLSGLRPMLLRAATSCLLAFGLLLFAAFFANIISGVSRVWLSTWAASVFACVCLTRVVWRGALRRQLRRGACFERVLVLAGSGEAARGLSDSLVVESGRHLGIAASHALPGLPGAPSLDWVEGAARSGGVDRVVVGHAGQATAQVNALLRRLTRIAIDVTVLPDLRLLQAPILHVDRIGMLPAIDLDFHPLTPNMIRIKRAEDLILAGLVTLFVMPVLLLVALAIRLDSPGPILFRQKRAGFNDRVFDVWKFRTMHAALSDGLAARQTSRQDARVTRVGRILRRTSLDELPQLFNVLRGDMSIVGPRPHALGMTAVGTKLHDVIEEYSARHRLKPGITGWAQVNGSRGAVDSHEKLRRRVALDCHYIENWSLGLDLWIILRTALKLLSDPDAY